MSILVATDCSEASREAVASATAFARLRDCPLTVATLVEEAETPPWSRQYEVPDDLEEEFRSEGRDQLETFWNDVVPGDERPDDVDLRVELGSPGDAIPELASAEGFDWIVVGATGRNRVAEILLGSTAEEIVRGSEVPVLVVPPDADRPPYETVLAPVDFSECSRRSLETAADVVRREGASLHILHSYVPPTADASALTPSVTPERLEQIRKDQREQFASFVQGSDLGGVSPQRRLEVGSPHDAIIDVAEQIDADAVVMGTHGRRGFERFFLGSTAAKVLRGMPCSVMTVRTRES